MDFNLTSPMRTDRQRTDLLKAVLTDWFRGALEHPDCSRINLCHFGAGSGEDAEIVLAAVTELESLIRSKAVRIEILFNEYNKSDFQNLKTRVKAATLAYPFPRRTVATFVRNEEALAIAKKNAWHMKEDWNLFLFGEVAFHKRFHPFFRQIEEFETTDLGLFLSSRFARQMAAKKKIDRQGLLPEIVCEKGFEEILKQFLVIYPADGLMRIHYRFFRQEMEPGALVVASRHLPFAERQNFWLAEEPSAVYRQEEWSRPITFPAAENRSLPI